MATKKQAKKKNATADDWFEYTTSDGKTVSLPPVGDVITVGDRRRAKRDGMDDEEFSWVILERAAEEAAEGTLDIIDAMRMDEFSTFMSEWNDGGNKSKS
ncbi:hypothetical protein [Corynebacterium amycolatum]|uniref:hypothetical protein n=1 Tax=Corynebacterium amycolatum TaxID=43765 RepID=UPI00191F22E6|nr:hypothetical protein [Corynebacterium amycolatum]QQU97780.1 hypothetical protein I6I65_10685 [Corynebacterium amycolatum]